MSVYTDIGNYLDNHPEGITNFEAFLYLRTTKLTTRVGEMNRSGKWQIESKWETHVNERGETKRYKRYFKAV